MQHIKNIIFDLGGVILDIDFKKMEKSFIELGIANFNDFFGLGHAASFFKEHESGRISDDEFLNSVQKLTGHSLPADAVQRAWNSLLISFPPERIALLKRLRTKYRLFLLSNTNGIHAAAFEKIYKDSFNNSSLSDLFDKIYYSHVIGFRKPNKKVYEYVLNESQLDPRQTLLIDDALVNVEAARQVDMNAIHLQPGMDIIDLRL